MEENPFVAYNSDEDVTELAYPEFPRTKQIKITISEETWNRLETYISMYAPYEKTASGSLGKLLELIGVYALNIKGMENIVDDESGISTEDCRQIGFVDAKRGDPVVFLAMYGRPLGTVFQEAYMRGYYEGNYIKNGGRKR